MEQFLKPKDAAIHVGTSQRFLMNQCRAGHGPTMFKPSPGTTLFRKTDLDAWIATWEVREPTK